MLPLKLLYPRSSDVKDAGHTVEVGSGPTRLTYSNESVERDLCVRDAGKGAGPSAALKPK